MKFAIISDVHANAEALRATLTAISKLTVNRIVCLGDVVGYNADPGACVTLLRQAGALCVAGNHDRAVTGQITTEGFSHTAARAVQWTRPRLDATALAYLRELPLTLSIPGEIVAVHGALHPERGQELVRLETDELRRQSFAALMRHPSGARICAFGHTHRLGIFEYENGTLRERTRDRVDLRPGAYYLINPGSVGQSRTADPRASFVVLDTDLKAVTVHRVAYDAEVALDKTRAAGLLPAFSFLPAPVRDSLLWSVRAAGLSDAVKRMVGSCPDSEVRKRSQHTRRRTSG
jgi:predicted phosphodiesterase